MEFFKYMPILILIFFSLKILISLIEKHTVLLKKNLDLSQIKNGMLSIKDLKKDNYDRFIKLVELYLTNLGFKDFMFFPNGTAELTNLKCSLNNENVYVSCIQNELLGTLAKDEDNWSLTNRPDIQRFLARVVSNDCNKGILIINSSFTDTAIEFIDSFNSKNLGIEIKVVDGYELTKSIRTYKSYNLKEDLINEV